jgi:polyisoprenyl-teichoic acid--peptidoglycan teichoic acid transferase
MPDRSGERAAASTRKSGSTRTPASTGRPAVSRRPAADTRSSYAARLASSRLANEETAVIKPVVVSGYRRTKTLGGALLITLLSAFLPGSGHLVLRRRTGWAILGGFALVGAAGAAFVLRTPRSKLIEYLLSTQVLALVIIGLISAAFAWIIVLARTYELARPRRLSTGQQLLGGALVFALCAAITAPIGYAAYTANSQRNLLNALFPGGGDGSQNPAGDANAIKKPRLNILLLGSDAGPDRIGTRTDTMVVASVDTKTSETILFSLPRNTAYAQFPSGSKMAQQFPNGFHDPKDPTSGNYLLNAVYAYGTEFPQVAPSGPSKDPGLNLLMSSISQMLGLSLDYYIEVNMAGFSSIIDALGGLDVNVGPERVPMGGIGPFGEHVKPFGYIEPGMQHLNGLQALWFARSRTNSTDYVRMGRQRCLMQYLIDQKSPLDVLKNFQAVASATTNSVSTNIPQEVLPALMTLAGKAKSHPLKSIAFDPSLPDPGQPDGKFNTGRPDFSYMRKVVRDAISPAAPRSSAAAAPTTTTPPPTTTRKPSNSRATTPSTPPTSQTAALPTSLGDTCGADTP